MNDEHHFRFSTFREKLVEHLLIGELLRLSWLRGECSLEVAKPEVDSRGYDVIIERSGIVRHVQLKASSRVAAATGQKVHVALAEKPSGCVLWVQFDSESMELGPFLFFGSPAGRPLPSMVGMKVGRHTKANAAGEKAFRPDIRLLPKSRFIRLETFDHVFDALFDPSSAALEGAQADLASYEAAFHDLIRTRCRELELPLPQKFPQLVGQLPSADAPAWFPVPGMYGGFSYWEKAGGAGIVVESWSRVVQGSGERHEIGPAGCELVNRGFV